MEGNQSAGGESAANGTTGEGQEQSFLSQNVTEQQGEEKKGEESQGTESQQTEAQETGEKAFEPKYTEQFPDHLKKNEKLTQYIKDNKLEKIGDFAEKLLELLEASGGAKVPGENATDEEKAAFRKLMGVPESPEQYDLNEITVPDGLPIDADVVTKKAHELGISQKQLEGIAQTVFDNIDKNINEGIENLENARGDVRTELEDLWGSDFKVNMEKVGQGTRLIGKLLIKDGMFKNFDQFKGYIDSGIGDDRAFIRAMRALTDALGEDSIGELGGPSGLQLKRDQFGRIEPNVSKTFPDK